MSLCSCLLEKPLIFAQRNSQLTSQIAKALDSQLNYLYSYRDDKEDIEGAP